MPVVPFRQQQPIPQLKPEVDDTYLAIAAASMHEMNRLFEQPEKVADASPSK